MKRTLFTVIAVVFATSVALAQNPFEPLLKGYKVVNTTSEQGHDRLDSIYYLHTKTYVVPYNGGKNANRVNEVVSKIMDLYNGQLPNYTGGFCYSSNLQDSLTTESSRISAYYTEYQSPVIIGGKGINYAVLRKQNASNPNYRTIYGVEWRVEQPDRVCFKVLSLYGPQTEQNYRKAMFEENRALGYIEDSLASQDKSSDFHKALLMDETEYAVQSIRVLCKMYRGDNNDTDHAVALVARDKFLNYLSSPKSTTDGRIRVMREMRIPGFYAEVTDGTKKQSGTLPWLAERWKDLNIFVISWDEGNMGSPRYGDQSRYLLLQVVLQ